MRREQIKINILKLILNNFNANKNELEKSKSILIRLGS